MDSTESPAAPAAEPVTASSIAEPEKELVTAAAAAMSPVTTRVNTALESTSTTLNAGHVCDPCWRKMETLENRIAFLEELLGEVDIDRIPQTNAVVLNSPLVSAAPITQLAPSNTLQVGTTTTENGEVETIGPLRYATVIANWNETKQEYVDTDLLHPDGDTDPLHPDNYKDSLKKKPVITYRKKAGGPKAENEIAIEDLHLIKYVRSTIAESGYDWSSSLSESSLKITSPYMTIVWYWDAFQKKVQSHEDDSEDVKLQKQDLKKLLEYVQDAPELVDYFKTRKDKPDHIAWTYLWTLFRPGETMVAKPFLNTPQLFFVASVLFDWHMPSNRDKKWVNTVICYDHTGFEWVRVLYSFEFSKYEHEKPINSLVCYPLRYYGEKNSDAQEQLVKERSEEGQQFITFCNLTGSQRMRRYDGMGYINERSWSNAAVFDSERDEDGVMHISKSKQKRIKLVGEVILDARANYEETSSLPLGDMNPDYWYVEGENMSEGIFPHRPDQAGGEEYIKFCSVRFFGYSSPLRTMAQLRVKNIHAGGGKDPGPFENELQLDDGHKQMMRALIEHQVNFIQDQQSADVLDIKGNGLVILLHGAPGTGKTLTAETVARATGKPLLPASAAEIGLRADQAQGRMESLFDRAQRWDAILLLDEADAFLESRAEGYSSDRNALVAVMLRTLEYYTGIIILTTNRLKVMDPALQSRIHLALHYEDLSAQQRLEIFKNTLRRFQTDAKTVERLGKHFFRAKGRLDDINGRETRNVVRSAVGLARSRGIDEEITEDDLDRVLDVLSEFRKSLHDSYVQWKNENQGTSTTRRR